jgi:hypothetical protein
MDLKYRKYLHDKHSAIKNERPMNPALNAVVEGMLRAGQVLAMASEDDGTDNSPWIRFYDGTHLFDPALNPALHEIADKYMAQLHTRMGLPEHDPHAIEYLGEDNPDTGALIHFVGDNRIFVCRKHPDVFAAFLKRTSDVGTYENTCTVRLSKKCGGFTSLLPLIRGRFVLFFDACWECRHLTDQIAENRFRTNVLEAQAKLPLGARIDPGSPVPPLPRLPH